jgi:hypothetical protein
MQAYELLSLRGTKQSPKSCVITSNTKQCLYQCAQGVVICRLLRQARADCRVAVAPRNDMIHALRGTKQSHEVACLLEIAALPLAMT